MLHEHASPRLLWAIAARPGSLSVQQLPCGACCACLARMHGAPTSPSQRPAPTVSGGLQVDSRALAAPARCSRAVPTASCLEGSPAASDSRVGRPLHRAATGRGGPARAECWTGRSAGTNGCRRRQASPIELLGPWHSPGWAWAGSAADLQLSPAVATLWPTQLESSICMGHQGRVGI